MLQLTKLEAAVYPWRCTYPESIYDGYKSESAPWNSTAELNEYHKQSLDKDSIDKDSLWGHETVVEMVPTEMEMQDDEERVLPGKPEKPAGPPLPFDPRQFPDGGATAWLCVLGGFCCMFASFGWISCIGVFQEHYQSHQLRHLAPSTISWIPSLEVFLMFLGGPIVGKLYDNYGPRWILLAGTFFHVFGLLMTSVSTEYYQFILAQGICSPIGASMVFYPSMSALSTWFFAKRAASFGIMAAGSSIGGMLMPIMIEQILPKIGFGQTMRVMALFILVLLIVANLTVKSRIPPSPKPLDVKEFFVPLTEVPFALVAAGCFLFFLGMFIPINYVILYAMKKGMSASLSRYLVSIMNALSLGRVITGFLADKAGRFNVITIMCFFTAIIDLTLWIPSSSNASIIVFAALYGFGSGTFVSMIPAIIAQISPDIRKIGVRTGTVYAVISFAALLGNPIGGALVQRDNGGFLSLQVFCGVMQLAGATVMLGARIVLGGIRPNVKV